MLRKFRSKKTQKKIWIIMAILILPAFLFWGTGSIMRGQKGPNYAGRIKGRKMSIMEFQDALRATRNQALIIWGDDFFKLEKQIDLQAQAWDRLLLLHEANRRRIKVSDAEVRDQIKSYPFFQKNSQFDLETYERLLRFMFSAQPREFEEQTRDNIKIRKLYGIITSGVNLTEEQIKNEYKKEYEEARVDYLSAIPADFLNAAQIEEKEMEDYFKNNTLEFKKPESFNLQYLEILYPADAKEADIRNTDEKAKSIFLKLTKERDMSKVSKEVSLETKETGFFSPNDPIPGIGWSAEVTNIVTKLKPAQLSPPIHTPKGWYFIKLKEKREPRIPIFEEVKNQVREKLSQAKAKAIAKKKIESAFSKIKDMYKISPASVDFNKLAKEFNLKSGETQFFKRASYIPTIGTSDNFFDALSKIKVGHISTVLEMEQGFYIIRLKQWKAINEGQYLKDKEDFSGRLLAFNKEKVFAEFLENLRKEGNLEINITKARPLF